jgi:hypothetical protein
MEATAAKEGGKGVCALYCATDGFRSGNLKGEEKGGKGEVVEGRCLQTKFIGFPIIVLFGEEYRFQSRWVRGWFIRLPT